MSAGFVLGNVPHNTREPPREATEDWRIRVATESCYGSR